MLQYKTRDQNYRDLAGSMRKQALRSGGITIYAGGISVSDKEANEDNDDMVTPAFTRGMFDDSFAIDKTSSNTTQEQDVSAWP